MNEKDLIANELHFNKIKEFEDILSVISGFFYWFLSLKYIISYKKWLNENITSSDYPTYDWVRNILIALGILIVILTFNIITKIGLQNNQFLGWQFFYFYLAILVYYLGFVGLHQQDFKVSFRAERKKEFPKNTDQILDVKQKLEKAMFEEKLYLDAELSLSSLSDKIGINPTLISAVINDEYNKNFRNYINDLRVEEVKKRLLLDEFKKFSILGIALDSGFNSEASFYRIFKNTTGLSPKEFINHS